MKMVAGERNFFLRTTPRPDEEMAEVVDDEFESVETESEVEVEIF